MGGNKSSQYLFLAARILSLTQKMVDDQIGSSYWCSTLLLVIIFETFPQNFFAHMATIAKL